MLNNFILGLDFEFGSIDGRVMTLTVNQINVESTAPSCDVLITLPGQVELIFSGKNKSADTKVDMQGQILADMYVKILSIRLDGLELPNWVVQKKLILITENGKQLNTSYIGFNGKIVITMPEKNVFLQYMKFCQNE